MPPASLILEHLKKAGITLVASLPDRWLGELIEFAPTNEMFTVPKQELTEAYITGRMG